MTTDNTTTKTVTAKVYGTQSETVRVAVPAALCDAPTGTKISIGVSLCGWYRGRKWGIIRTYSIWTMADGCAEGDIYTAYRLNYESDREAFDWVCSNGDAKYNEF